jgi:hypothetical protein
MLNRNSDRSQFRSFPKKNSVGTGGIREILMSDPPYSGHSRNAGNGRERPGTGRNHEGVRNE